MPHDENIKCVPSYLSLDLLWLNKIRIYFYRVNFLYIYVYFFILNTLSSFLTK